MPSKTCPDALPDVIPDVIPDVVEEIGIHDSHSPTLATLQPFSEQCSKTSNFIKIVSNTSNDFCPPSPTSYKTTLLKMWPKINVIAWNKHPFIDIYNAVLLTGLPNFLVARRPLPSGLNINNWRKSLPSYHDKQIVDFLEFGWPVGYTSSKLPIPTYSNHKELLDYSTHINNYIETELFHEALLGPFKISPFTPWANYSPIMTREKKNTSKRTIIVNLSFPKKFSVNSGISKGFYLGKPIVFTLPTINDIIKNISDSLESKFMWSIDLARAYRQLRTDPLSVPLLGITFNNNKFFDLAPPFGCRTSAMACARTTNAVVFLLKNKGFTCFCYLDDFLGIEDSFVKSQIAYNAALNLLKFLGLQVSPSKCIPPTQKLNWIGYEINAKEKLLKIPKEKLTEIITDCKKWKLGNLATRKQIEQIAGRINFVAKCIKPARVYMNRILDFLRCTPKNGSNIITKNILSDLDWFIKFSEKFNGLILMKNNKNSIIWNLECDACLQGGGSFSKNSYISEKFSLNFTSLNLPICQIEAINLTLTIKELTPLDISNLHVIIKTDNKTSQCILDSGYGKDKIITACARFLSEFSAINNIEITVIHSPGELIPIADAMSRAFISKDSKNITMQYCLDNSLTRVRASHFDMYSQLLLY